ncbi:tRNA (uracil(54)-C(5))-methyltransferase [Diutina catenulata]
MIWRRYASSAAKSHAKLAKRLARTHKRDTADQTSRANVLHREVTDAARLIGISSFANPVELMETYVVSRHRPETVVELDIVYASSEGGGIGFIPKQDYAVPFLVDDATGYTAVCVPKTVVGDRVRAKLTTHYPSHAEGDLVDVVAPGPGRDDRRVVCSKFNECNGCSLQMVSYDDQLDIKQDIIKRAYRYFYPNLDQGEDFGFVVGSPMQYAYRNKLTPHYKTTKYTQDPNEVPIGLLHVNKGVVDFDNCPLAVPSINRALPFVRSQARKTMLEKKPGNYTILLRDSLHVDGNGTQKQVCHEGSGKIITQKVGKSLYQFNSSSFFQNNSFIMPDLVDFIKASIGGTKFQYLIDAYCGSGFFSVALAKEVDAEKVFGIEIDPSAIKYAEHNAKLNGMGERVTFVQGDATNMFGHAAFQELGLEGDNTIVVMDPSRKGSTPEFMKQLNDFAPKMVVYVSCNVFTQARDLACLEKIGAAGGPQYQVESVMGFDLFPQTKHVESVAILKRVD